MSEAERSPRYLLLRELGRGGMGVVTLVHDAVRGEDVAMKRISAADADAVVRFKREFRVMEGLHHPSLVRLHELGADDAGLYFTMELVRGVTLRRYCRPELEPDQPTISGVGPSPLAITGSFSAGLDAHESVRTHAPAAGGAAGGEALARLVAVLPQLLGALAFLHARGIVHRDLKPGNVMVTPEGRLKLLDFGILSELGRRPESDGPHGTVGYIAPEVLRGEPAVAASDLYALGAMMFDIVAGHPVFDGDPLVVLQAHLGSPPPRLSDVTRGVPPAVVDACASLLEKTPAARPSIDQLARSLFGDAVWPPSGPSPEVPQATLGREDEKRALRAALERARRGAFVWTAIVGPSGSGKTTLARWAADEAQRRGALVLHGRGRPTERLPFNAVDGAIDELALALRDRDLEDADLQESLACASSAFPVLAACCVDHAPVSSRRARAVVFDACARVLAHVARTQPILMFIDDLQWADDDSRAALEHLLDVGPGGVLVVTTIRDDVEAPAAVRALLARSEVTTMALGALDDGALAALVGNVARAEGVELGPDTVRRAVLACAGRPFLAEVTARALAHDRHAAVDEHDLTAAMLAPVLRAHAPLLALLVAADGFLDLGALAELRRTSVGATQDAMSELARAGVARTAGAAGQVALYHDVVRAAALDALGPEALVEAHGALADWLASRPGSRLEPRVGHLLGARREKEAAALAREAAAHASGQRAYALAADMLEIALRDPDADRAALLRRRAEALDHAARYAEAARSWAGVAALAQGDAALDATLCEAASLIASHDLQAGMARLREGLVRAGLPPIRRSKLTDALTGLRFLAGPPSTLLVARKALDPAAVPRCERDLRVALLVVYLDPLAGTRLLQRVRTEASRAGAPEVAAWCDWTFAYYALFMNARAGPVPLADRYVASARERIAEPSSDRTAAMAEFVAGLAAEREGDWDAATSRYERALVSAERVGFGTTEHALVLMNRAQVDLFAQRFHGLAQRLATMRAVSRASPQTTVATYADIVDSFALVYQGRTAEARALHADVLRRLEAGGENRLAHAVRLVGYAIDVYEDRPGAHLRFARDLEAGRRFGATRYMRLGAILALGALVEANALRRREAGASFATVTKLARRSLEAPPYLVGAAYRAMAYAEDARGEHARALILLERAEREAHERGQRVDRAIARYQRGRRLPGTAGASLIAAAEQEVEAAGGSASALRDDAGGR